MFLLTLVYLDSSQFIVGGFNSSDDANAWVTAEQLKPSWTIGTIANIVDNTPAPRG